jgi:hypothetical protein
MRQGLKGLKFKTSPGDPISTNKKLGMVACAWHTSYLGSVNKENHNPGHPGIKSRPYLKKQQKQKGLGVWHKEPPT